MEHLEIGKIEDREGEGIHGTPANSDMVNDEGKRTRTKSCGSHSDVMLAPVSCENCMSHFLVRHAIESPISITSTAG